jgi:hypothetical protein
VSGSTGYFLYFLNKHLLVDSPVPEWVLKNFDCEAHEGATIACDLSKKNFFSDGQLLAVHYQAASFDQTFCEGDLSQEETVFAEDLKVLVVRAVQKHELAGILRLWVLWEFPLNLFLLAELPAPTRPG